MTVSTAGGHVQLCPIVGSDVVGAHVVAFGLVVGGGVGVRFPAGVHVLD